MAVEKCPSDWAGLVQWMTAFGAKPVIVPIVGGDPFGFDRVAVWQFDLTSPNPTPVEVLCRFSTKALNQIPNPFDVIADEVAGVFNRRMKAMREAQARSRGEVGDAQG